MSRIHSTALVDPAATLDASVLAHTSPVDIDVAGQRVARVADAHWCLEFLDTLEQQQPQGSKIGTQ